MSHADNGTLMALLDGELPDREQSAIELHLRACQTCAEDLAELSSLADEFSSAVALVDAPAPVLRARVALQPASGSATSIGRSPRWRAVPRDLLKAAAIVLLLAGAASAAIPGSPVRQLVDRAVRLIRGESAPVQVPATVAEPAPGVPAAVREPSAPVDASIPVSEGRARISIHSPAAAARITVRLVDADRVTVRWDSEDEGVRFRTAPGSIDIYQVETALVVEIPRTLDHATVEVDAIVYYLKDGSQASILGPGGEVSGDEVVFQARR